MSSEIGNDNKPIKTIKFDPEAAAEASQRWGAYVRLREAGCKFFPLLPNSKRPACKWKSEQTTEIINGNIGVAIPPGMVVIDIDTEDSLERVRCIEGWAEDTFSVKTPRGRHFYWQTSGRFRFTQFAGNNPVFGKNVDLRVGGDGYLVGPFSEISGRKYKIATDSRINQMPASLEEMLIKKDVAKVIAKESGGKNYAISEGGRDNMLARVAGFLFNTHASEEEIRQALHGFNNDYCEPPLLDVDIERVWRSIGSKRGSGKFNGVFVEPGIAPADTMKACLDKIGVGIRYNLRSWRIELDWQSGWQAADDLIEAQIDHEIRSRCIESPRIVNNNGRIGGMEPVHIKGQAEWNKALNVCAGFNAIDPFEDLYLNTLTPKQDTELLDGWIETLLPLEDNADNKALARWASRYIFLGIVQRTKEPGCKLDEILTLHGEQGIGKSAVCASIIPHDFREECFTDRLILTSSPKEAAESIQGVVLAEASEMTGMSKADIEKVKALITTTQDRVRLAYRKNTETISRRCIFVGTSNTDCLPNDPTGNRRFVVVKTTGNRANFKVETWLDDNRDKLFAAALYEYQQGERANLPRSLAAAQASASAEYRITDDLVEDACIDAIPVFERIAAAGEWLDSAGINIDPSVKVIKVDDAFIVTLRNICIVVAYLINSSAPMPMATHLMQHRVKQALLQCGWQYIRKRLDNKQRRAWLPPETDSNQSDIEPAKSGVQTEIDIDDVPF